MDNIRYGYIIICLGVIVLAGCGIQAKPIFTAKKDLSNTSKPNYEAKIEVYKVIDLEKLVE